MKINMIAAIVLTAGSLMMITGCGKASSGNTELTVLAAASLTDVCGELEEMYEKEHPETQLTFSYGSSGALQAQIEEGAPADLFISASTKQMDALEKEDLMKADSVTELLENRLVLIVPRGSDKEISSFEDVGTDKVGMVAMGDPDSVPAGQYAEEVFTSLGIYGTVKDKVNYGSDVRAVLTWVEEGEADCGVVYATDAYTSDKVEIAAQAPDGSCRRIIYPAGIVKSTANESAAEEFLDYLKSDKAMKVFERYGF